MTKGAAFKRIVDRTDVNADVTSKTSNYTALETDDLILCNATGGAFTITLYTAVGNNGRGIVIKKTDSSVNTVEIDGDGAETIDGESTMDLNFQNSSIVLISDNSNWVII